MAAPTLTAAQLAALEAAEDDLEDGFQSGYKKPDTSTAIPALTGYSKAQNVNGVDYRETAKAPFKTILVTTMRHLNSLVESPTTIGNGSLSNSWVYDNSGPYNLPGYYKDPLGIVHLQGKLASGSQGTIFTLPSGYRPANTNTLATYGTTAGAPAVAIISVTSAGVVSVAFTATVLTISLDGLTFRAV